MQGTSFTGVQEVVPIIPQLPQYYTTSGSASLDYPALCCFAALGFFLDDDTHFTNRKAYRPGSNYKKDNAGNIVFAGRYFEWNYQPREIPFHTIVEEFMDLFEGIVRSGTTGKKPILPLSGGLDSRTLAAAMIGHPDTAAYSYEFENGIPENEYGNAIARICGFPFSPLTIPHGYLWNKIESAASINECFSEFTHPRQIATMDLVSTYGDQFLLGHWGDVLFDDMGMGGSYSEAALTEEVKKKVVKKGGTALARQLWQQWGLAGTFDDYFTGRIAALLAGIKIDDPNAKVRAFKSLYWAPRWTSVNLTFFAHEREIFVPYYHDDMCRFICTIPETYLAGRKIQIEYLKRKSKALASIPWQKYTPANLYNYNNYYSWKLIPSRAWRRIKSELKPARNIRRNWELQFTGEDNMQRLGRYLNDPALVKLTSQPIIEHFVNGFREHPVEMSHPVSMLLTLSLFAKRNLV